MVQRAASAKVEVAGEVVGQIGRGLLVYLSVAGGDTERDAEFMAEKLANLRIFADGAGKFNLNVQNVSGEVLLVSNFTLHADCRKGSRPGLDAAAGSELAERLYERVAELIAAGDVGVQKGRFAAHMHVSSVNNGPATFLLDSPRLF